MCDKASKCDVDSRVRDGTRPGTIRNERSCKHYYQCQHSAKHRAVTTLPPHHSRMQPDTHTVGSAVPTCACTSLLGDPIPLWKVD